MSTTNAHPGIWDAIIYVHSGGTDSVTGEPSFASQKRFLEAYGLYMVISPLQQVLLVVGGEQTRKSGPWSQANKLAEYVRRKFPEGTAVQAYPYSTDETFRRLSDDHPQVKEVYFVNDDVHIKRYLTKFRLIDRDYAKRIKPKPVPKGVGYDANYSPDYVTCYNALGWAVLAAQYLKAKRLDAVPVILHALGFGLAALWRVGPQQLVLFAQDRRLNKESDNPGVQRKIADIKKRIRPDLLGE